MIINDPYKFYIQINSVNDYLYTTRIVGVSIKHLGKQFYKEYDLNVLGGYKRLNQAIINPIIRQWKKKGIFFTGGFFNG